MTTQTGYLIIDIGTGNVRVAITDQQCRLLLLETDNVRYSRDELYPDAVHFDPKELWEQILVMTRKAIAAVPGLQIIAITASSQREGIVLIDDSGEGLIGLSNHDHRGREWEDIVKDKHHVYALTGRYPGSLFSAMKLVGIRNRRPEIYQQVNKILSISDWAQFQLCGITGYEHSQASETLLYDVAGKEWSTELCEIFEIDPAFLPPLVQSGTVLGKILPVHAEALKISADALVIVGGADTQLAIKSTMPSVEDIVIVSGTTTPIVKITNEYITDSLERTWTNRHIDAGSFILEANAGVTGLNYQRLKEIFYPNEPYELIEQELAEDSRSQCVASLGSRVAEEKSPLTMGGFVFNTPVSHELKRAHFVRATLWDIACAIKENLDVLASLTENTPSFVWACGGGFQSMLLRRFIANLTGKTVRIREGYRQASVTGAAIVCSEALGVSVSHDSAIEELQPDAGAEEIALYQKWKKTRAGFRKRALEDFS